jgi:excisionase family DNA binding protein
MMKTNNPKTGHRSELPVLSERVSLGVREAAAALGVSEGLVRKCLPELPHIHLGERVLIPVDELKRWLRERARAEQDASRRASKHILEAVTRDR